MIKPSHISTFPILSNIKLINNIPTSKIPSPKPLYPITTSHPTKKHPQPNKIHTKNVVTRLSGTVWYHLKPCWGTCNPRPQRLHPNPKPIPRLRPQLGILWDNSLGAKPFQILARTTVNLGRLLDFIRKGRGTTAGPGRNPVKLSNRPEHSVLHPRR